MKTKYKLLLFLALAGILKNPMLAQKYESTCESLKKVNILS
jgi:hypothetical protein